jgi:hypothetical protein
MSLECVFDSYFEGHMRINKPRESHLRQSELFASYLCFTLKIHQPLRMATVIIMLDEQSLVLAI